MKPQFVAAGVALVIGCASASSAKEPVHKWSVGVRSCARFAEEYISDPELSETLYYIWAEGFMTGFNVVRASVQGKASDLNPYDRSEQWRRESIREYCSAHPLSPYSEAVTNLILELAKPSSQ